VAEARRFLASLGAATISITKIETHQALNFIDAILEETDGLMVARSDLGLAIPLERVAFVQKHRIASANCVGKPVITATQMLLSMVSNPRPSRAEATDVANAAFFYGWRRPSLTPTTYCKWPRMKPSMAGS
jgi:pyruvate kinase